MVSDGVLDVMNEKKISFGKKRLYSSVENSSRDPSCLNDSIMDAMNKFRGNSIIRDDLTMLSFRIAIN